MAFAVDATPDEVASVLIETTSPILCSLMSQLAVMQSSSEEEFDTPTGSHTCQQTSALHAEWQCNLAGTLCSVWAAC